MAGLSADDGAPDSTSADTLVRPITSNVAHALNKQNIIKSSTNLHKEDQDVNGTSNVTVCEPIKESEDSWDNEPANPLNWSAGRKWKNVGIVAAYTFVS